jgi:hypothetical protein
MPIMPESTRASLALVVVRSLPSLAWYLPLAGLLGRLSTPLGSTSSGGGGVPAGGGRVSAPLAGSTGRGSLPVSTGGEGAGLDSGRANLVGGGELLLLNLLLGLGLRVAVYEVLVSILGARNG